MARIVDEVEASEVPRAVAAAMSIASSRDLTVDEAIVLHDSNKLTLRVLPCDLLARVAAMGLTTTLTTIWVCPPKYAQV
jgi:hypothetical protein